MIIWARSRRILLYSTKLRAILIRLATILLLTACSDSSRRSLSMTLGGIVTVELDDVPVSVKARDRLLFLAVVQHPDGVKDLSIFGSGGKGALKESSARSNRSVSPIQMKSKAPFQLGR